MLGRRRRASRRERTLEAERSEGVESSKSPGATAFYRAPSISKKDQADEKTLRGERDER
jgi:hypothetical protein